MENYSVIILPFLIKWRYFNVHFKLLLAGKALIGLFNLSMKHFVVAN